MDTSDDDEDTICKELLTTAEALYNQIIECTTLFKTILEKISDKSSITATRILSPKTSAAKKWLRLLGGTEEFITYDEFLDLFFDLYEREGRLDFATRTLTLRPVDATLFQLEADVPVSIYSFLGQLPRVFT